MSQTDILWELFWGLVCICGDPKKASMSHCRNCYYSLPGELRNQLYRKFRNGYEAAYIESVTVLAKQKSGEELAAFQKRVEEVGLIV